MSSTFHNILLISAGVIIVVASIKVIARISRSRKTYSSPDHSELGNLGELEAVQTRQNSIGDKPSTPIVVTEHKSGSAKDAFLSNVRNLKPLFDALANNSPFSEAIHDAIIDINNNELLSLWRKIGNNNASVVRILGMWGIRKEDETQFQAQSYHKNRYATADDSLILQGQRYQVVIPCWVQTTTTDEGKSHKEVLFKGLAREI